MELIGILQTLVLNHERVSSLCLKISWSPTSLLSLAFVSGHPSAPWTGQIIVTEEEPAGKHSPFAYKSLM